MPLHPFGKNHNLRTLLMALVVLLSLSLSSFAQSTFGTITGTVTDPTGAVLPNATVTITNKNTQAVRTVTANGEGTYLAVNLDPGVYRIEASATGFGKFVREAELLARQIVRVDAHLETASMSAQVDVVASGAITTETPTIADSKSGREINGLALNFRATTSPSPIVVATMAPGVQQDRGGNISVAGGQPYTTLTIQTSMTFVRRESVTVPAGTFDSCLFHSVATTSGGTTITDDWIAPNVGIVKMVVPNGPTDVLVKLQ